MKKKNIIQSKAETSSKNNVIEPKKESKAKDYWIWIVLLITFIAFLPSLQNGFVNWDDDVNVLQNKDILALDLPHLKAIFTHDVIGNYNPLPILTFALEYHFVQFEPYLYHIDNLLLHLVCTLFAFLFLRSLGLSSIASALAAILFGIHPMRVESVAWVTERKDVLFGVFYMCALWLYVKWCRNENKSPLLYIGIMLLFMLSLFSKIQAVSLPLSMLAIDYFFNRSFTWKVLLEKLPFFLLSLAFGILGIYMLKENKSLVDHTLYPFYGRLAIGAFSLLVYLVKWVVPFEMLPLYAYPLKLSWYIYASFLPALLFLFLIWKWHKQQKRALVFGLVFFLFNVMFMLQILGAGQGYLADRFTYIPYLGLFFVMGYAYDFWKNNHTLKLILPAISVLYLFVMFIVCKKQIEIWKDGEALWTRVIESSQRAPLPFVNRAIFYRDKGFPDRAMLDFQQAITLKPQASTYNSIGKLYFDKGDTTNALLFYNKAISLDSTIAEILINRAVVFGASGKYDIALRDFNKGLALEPNNVNGYFNRSLLFTITGQYEKAIADHTACLNLDSSKTELYYERGNCKLGLKRYQEAIQDISIAIQRSPKGIYYQERAIAYYSLGEKEKAKNDVSTAIRMGQDVPLYLRTQLGL
jgi:tetratricopeptide (TPR) repeat protein